MEKKNNGNKENLKNGTITNMFKVKKCLFDLRNKVNEISPPKSIVPLKVCSPLNNVNAPEDSPYSLFKIKKKRSVLRYKTIGGFGNSSPSASFSTPSKLYKDAIETVENSENNISPNGVKLAVQKSINNPDLIGDFSKPCALPVINGRHPDLKSVSIETVAAMVQGCECHSYTLIDCRYPYEYNAGHIKTAQNIYLKEEIVKSFLEISATSETKQDKLLIFYCEFSSERGPSMLRHLRNMDRDMNKECYPFLYYPELYVMEGGYKAFYASFKELCDPQEYKAMLDVNCTKEFAFFRSKSKASARRTKSLKRTRSSLAF